ncbi:MAG TPA: TadE family protein, partial [Candidatus Angelobacter sp.]|nr:TadE family protein [Candidatus Angelobacter sp.]
MWLRNLIRRQRHDEGQSLLETAIAMPLLLGIAFNLINLGYFWFVVLSLAAAPRQGVQYSTQGGASITTAVVPSAS